MKIGDPVMRVFTHGDNWIGVITWISSKETCAKVKWAHDAFESIHHISVLKEVVDESR